MKKEEILNKYQQEDDEGIIFLKNKALIHGYGCMVIVGIFLMFMSFLLTDDDIIANVVYLLLLPFLFLLYGFRAYFLKDKSYFFIAFVWFTIFCFRFYDMISVLF